MDELKFIEPPAKVGFYTYVGDRQSCGNIRVVIPSILMNSLRVEGYNFESDYSATFIADPKFYRSYTSVSFQRAATKKHLELIKYYKSNIRKIIKVPVVFEIDDLLYDIPQYNYASTYYQNVSESTKEIMRIVDGITVSTETLKRIYSEFNERIVIIPNHLPKFLWGDIIPKHENNPREKRPRILYAGSENHFINKGSVEYKKGIRGGDFGDILIDYIRKTVDKYEWVFSGAYPLELEDLINKGKIERHGWKHIWQYPKHVKALDVDIWIAPLMKCIFNDSKSNIKGLEASATGCPGIYSNADPYEKFMLTCESEYDIIANIEKLADSIDFRKEVFDHDYSVVKDQLFWEDNSNILKYINSHLSLFKRVLKT